MGPNPDLLVPVSLTVTLVLARFSAKNHAYKRLLVRDGFLVIRQLAVYAPGS